MICPMCRDEKATWENVDKYRIKPEGMAICSSCGFVSYPEKYKTKQEIIDYYKAEYRNPPQVNNLYTGQRKLHYHAAFLSSVMDEFKKKKIESPVVTDIGAAFGMFLKWFRDFFPKADVNGVELTESFVRNAWHLYNIKLTDDFDDSKKYDLISSYKSLEHILDPDIELTRYIDALKDDGYLYLSVPIWFRKLNNFGASGWDIEYYYSTNHINVWNLEQFKALVQVCGGKIVKEDHDIYETTYLIKRDTSLRTSDRSSLKQNVDKIKEDMNKIFTVNEAYETANYNEAIKIWPNFPHAHVARYENDRKKWNDLGFDVFYKEVIQRALKDCPNDSDIEYLAADVCMRYNQYEMAIDHLNRCHELRPNAPHVYISLGNIFRAMAKNAPDKETREKYIIEARKVSEMLKTTSAQHVAESTNNILNDNANLPTPFEE